MNSFGQHIGQADRSRRYQSWLNCQEVDVLGRPVDPVVPVEPTHVIKVIIQQLASNPEVVVDVSGVPGLEESIKRTLSEDQLRRVKFSK